MDSFPAFKKQKPYCPFFNGYSRGSSNRGWGNCEKVKKPLLLRVSMKKNKPENAVEKKLKSCAKIFSFPQKKNGEMQKRKTDCSAVKKMGKALVDMWKSCDYISLRISEIISVISCVSTEESAIFFSTTSMEERMVV